MAMHGILRLKDRKVVGGGDEWYKVTKGEVIEIYNAIEGTSLIGYAG